ncbi:MAG: septal ring lytic transglycosylase RlpA family protein [Gammaproteobacteria bacterium]
MNNSLPAEFFSRLPLAFLTRRWLPIELRQAKIKTWLALTILALAAGCAPERPTEFGSIKDGAPTDIPVDLDAIPDAVPRYEPRTAAGNPESYEVLGKTYRVLKSSKGYVKQGIASWYGTKFHGRHTSNGEDYDMFAMTAAHKTLPIPAYARVTNLGNGRSVVVRINDRGPFHDNRIIDLSYVAAAKLGITEHGTGFVEVVALEPDQSQASRSFETVRNDIYLQIGAFSDPGNVQALKNKLKENRLPEPRVKSAVQNRTVLYKVQFGPLVSVENADELNDRLAAIGITETRYIVDNDQN